MRCSAQAQGHLKTFKPCSQREAAQRYRLMDGLMEARAPEFKDKPSDSSLFRDLSRLFRDLNSHSSKANPARQNQ